MCESLLYPSVSDTLTLTLSLSLLMLSKHNLNPNVNCFGFLLFELNSFRSFILFSSLFYSLASALVTLIYLFIIRSYFLFARKKFKFSIEKLSIQDQHVNSVFLVRSVFDTSFHFEYRF